MLCNTLIFSLLEFIEMEILVDLTFKPEKKWKVKII